MTNRIIKFRSYGTLNGERTMLSHAWIMHTIKNTEYGLEDIGNLMQFTGLHDKNGKEIYEGDVVMYVGMDGKLVGGRVMEVCYPDCFDGEADGSLYVPENWEVIGNVYESPELLNQ